MEELDFLELAWKGIVFFSLVTAVLQLLITAPYGRFSRAGWGFTLDPRFTWVMQESPSFVVPLFVAGYLGGNQLKGTITPNVILLAMFLLHYFQRYLFCFKNYPILDI